VDAGSKTGLRQASPVYAKPLPHKKSAEQVKDYAKDHPQLTAALTTFISAVNRS
jgi:hypothetical protein